MVISILIIATYIVHERQSGEDKKEETAKNESPPEKQDVTEKPQKPETLKKDEGT